VDRGPPAFSRAAWGQMGAAPVRGVSRTRRRPPPGGQIAKGWAPQAPDAPVRGVSRESVYHNPAASAPRDLAGRPGRAMRFPTLPSFTCW
jgi:hypothetical protein